MSAGRQVLVLLAAVAALAVAAAPATAGSGNDSSKELRRAVSADGIKKHELALQLISNVSGGNRLGCDTFRNLSDTALEQMGDAAAHATITLAQSDDLPGPAAAAASGARALRSAGTRYDALHGPRPIAIGEGGR
jgi:hypothetical protein